VEAGADADEGAEATGAEALVDDSGAKMVGTGGAGEGAPPTTLMSEQLENQNPPKSHIQKIVYCPDAKSPGSVTDASVTSPS
jgi:hypothetical protein